MVIGLVNDVVHPVFAHNFVKNSDVHSYCKIEEFKVESNSIANSISDSKTANWHISKSQEYWGINEMNTLTQQNATLANSLSSAINNLYSMSGSANPDLTIASQNSVVLNQLLDQVEASEISSSVQNNATIQSLATLDVLNQVLIDYADAIGSKEDLTNMANMNMNNMSMGSSGSMSGMSGMSGMKGMSGMNMGSSGSMTGTQMTIVDAPAYQSSQQLEMQLNPCLKT